MVEREAGSIVVVEVDWVEDMFWVSDMACELDMVWIVVMADWEVDMFMASIYMGKMVL